MEEPKSSFDAEEVVWQYRFAHETKDASECLRLRSVWKEWQGEDSLHEMAWGEPIEPEAIAERRQVLIAKQVEAELAWLSVFNPDGDSTGRRIAKNRISGQSRERQRKRPSPR